jgi:hypothetical protein
MPAILATRNAVWPTFWYRICAPELTSPSEKSLAAKDYLGGKGHIARFGGRSTFYLIDDFRYPKLFRFIHRYSRTTQATINGRCVFRALLTERCSATSYLKLLLGSSNSDGYCAESKKGFALDLYFSRSRGAQSPRPLSDTRRPTTEAPVAPRCAQATCPL